MVNVLVRRVISAIRLIKLRMKERSYNGRLKYLYFDNDADTLWLSFRHFRAEIYVLIIMYVV